MLYTRIYVMGVDQNISIDKGSIARGVHLGNSNHASQVKTLIEQSTCLPLRAFVGLFLTYQYFDLTGQETTD